MIKIFKSAGWKTYNYGEAAFTRFKLTDELAKLLTENNVDISQADKLEFNIKDKTLSFRLIKIKSNQPVETVVFESNISDMSSEIINTIAQNPAEYLKNYVYS